jgi:CubicO group peptidase (beta-lactamase class C family)
MLVLALLPAAVRAEPAATAETPLARIDRLLDDAVARKQVAGAVALVYHDGKIVYRAAVGQADRETQQPMQDDTIFRIASMTKPITSAAVMMLVDRGKLRLDDPVSKYLPEFADVQVLPEAARQENVFEVLTSRAREPITIRHLLNHTSGISYRFWNRPTLGRLYREYGVIDGLSETPGTVRENMQRLAKAPLWLEPGSGWEYGLNIDALGTIVEIVSGQTLDEFFRREILGPLKMRDTHFILPPEKHSRLAALYAPDEQRHLRRIGTGVQTVGELQYSATYPTWQENRYFSGGAGLVSTADDYLRFLRMLLGRGELDGVRLLKPETVDMMASNQTGDLKLSIQGHGDAFGYGFAVLTKAEQDGPGPHAGTYSWGGIFHTFFWVDPRERTIGLLLTQIYPFSHLTLREEFQRVTYAALAPLPAK